MEKKISYKLLFIGLLLLMFNSNFIITGNAIGSMAFGLSSIQILGFIFVLSSIIVFWISKNQELNRDIMKAIKEGLK